MATQLQLVWIRPSLLGPTFLALDQWGHAVCPLAPERVKEIVLWDAVGPLEPGDEPQQL